MNESKNADKEIKIQFDRLSQTQSNRVLSFEKYPNGFYINKNSDAAEFFSSTVTHPTKRDKLSSFLSHLDIIRKFGTTKFAISIPEHPFEQIQALKLINESIIVWTNKYVYKIPVSEKALVRNNESEQKADIIRNLGKNYLKHFLLPETLKVNNLQIHQTVRCRQLPLHKEQFQLVDKFLAEYFTLVLKKSSLKDTLHSGLQHGDLHYFNLFMTPASELLISDIDMLQTDGFPFLDLMHFAVHLLRNVEQVELYEPFSRFLTDKSYLYTALGDLGFVYLSDMWLKYYRDEYILMYLDTQLSWCKKNQNNSDQLQQIEQLKRVI